MKTILLVLFSSAVNAHEMTPTYFKFKNSTYSGIYETNLSLFNKREDQSYYAIGVFDKDFEHVPFAAKSRILKVEPNQRSKVTVYVRKNDLDRVVYVCTVSKTPKGQTASTGITSRICSKRKE